MKIGNYLRKSIVLLFFQKKKAIEEVRQVGSYKKGTMLRGYNVADIVIILKTLPTFKAIESLGGKIHEEIKILMKSEIITINEMIAFCVTDYGLDFWNKMAKVCLFFKKIIKVTNSKWLTTNIGASSGDYNTAKSSFTNKRAPFGSQGLYKSFVGDTS